MRTTVHAIALVGAILGFTTQALAWGQEGHSIVAEIAQRHLSPAAASAVQDILKKGRALSDPSALQLTGTISLASVASWGDDWRASHPETGPWHFVDVPFDLHNGVPPEQISYEHDRDCTPDPAGPTCVVDAVQDQLQILGTTPAVGDTAGQLARYRALLFVVHFIGDMHQPLHCIDRNGDLGGNKLAISFKGKRPNGSNYSFSGNLHSLWDTGMIQMEVYDWGAYVDEIESNVMPNLNQAALTSVTLADWTNECHAIGIKAYRSLPAGTPDQADYQHAIQLTNNYSDQVMDDLSGQLAKAGLRLASELQAVLAP